MLTSTFYFLASSKPKSTKTTSQAAPAPPRRANKGRGKKAASVDVENGDTESNNTSTLPHQTINFTASNDIALESDLPVPAEVNTVHGTTSQ